MSLTADTLNREVFHENESNDDIIQSKDHSNSSKKSSYAEFLFKAKYS